MAYLYAHQKPNVLASVTGAQKNTINGILHV
jgi:hypothetical protein